MHIRSDNRTNLVGEKRELQNSLSEWNQSGIQRAMLQKGINWTFLHCLEHARKNFTHQGTCAVVM